MLQFDHRWNYPGCLGAIDRKHIRIQKPAGSGSLFYNYKHFSSLVLMAVVNGNYEFIYVDVGAEGRCADGGVWGHSDFKQAVDTGRLNIPHEVRLDDNKNISCHFVGDDAFALSTRLKKRYLIIGLAEHEESSRMSLGSWQPNSNSYVVRSD